MYYSTYTVLLYSTGNQSLSCNNFWSITGKNTELLCYIPEINIISSINYTLIKKRKRILFDIYRGTYKII